MKRKIILTTLMMIAGIISASAQDDWKLQKDKDGIKVYSAQYPNSKIRAIKVVATFDGTPGQVADLVMDINTASEWVSHLKSSYLVKRISENELYYYAEVNLPWPVANRDFVAHLTRTENLQTKTITIDGPAVAGFVPEQKGIVRINNSVGTWIITPIENNQVKVEYALHVDPAGEIPSWLVNLFSTETPLEIFQKLRLVMKRNPQETSSVMMTVAGTK
jgi:hypothetical protein